MRYPRYVLLLALLMTTLFSQAQLLGKITVKAGQYARHNTIMRATLPQFHIQLMSAQLVNVQDGKKIVTPVQMEGEHTIVWRMEGDLPAGQERVYELWSKNDKSAAKVTVRTTNTAYIVEKDKKPVLQYNYAVMEPPAGVDTAFRRSGFIHPAWTPSGKVLTNIHPKDHYHHFGIWNPWTHTKYENDTIDFWNLKQLTGTVRFSKPARTWSGKVSGGFMVTQQHVVLSKPEKIAMVESLEVTVYDGKDNEQQVWDYNSILRCAGSSPITLLEYRYGGGFAIRGAAEWNNENSAVLTSEGKTRKDADNTHGRWFKVAGALSGGKGGLLVLSAPDNFNSPQPVRIWPEKDQQGQVFAMFSPTKDRDWVLTPGNTYPQKYRVVSFDGDLTVAQAEAYWNDYAHPPECTFSK